MDLVNLLDGEPEEEEQPEPAVDTPYDLRPDLTLLGLQEHDRGVVEDTYENRQALRAAQMNWDPVYSQTGHATGLISARTKEQTKERRVLSLLEKKPVLADPSDKNSDYLTGLDLLVDEAACKITPPWVINATREYIKEQGKGGPSSPKRAAKTQPHRCRIVKEDGIRCMLWSSGRIKDDGLCRVHLRTVRKPGEDVERARKKLIQAAPYAVDTLEELMESAQSEPVRLKASTEILDRAGLRGGMELDVGVEVKDIRPAHVVLSERLNRLALGAQSMQNNLMGKNFDGSSKDGEIIEVEAIENGTDSGEDIELDGPIKVESLELENFDED